MYTFDSQLSRRHTRSVKWDLADDLFGRKGILPLWVADMDFPSPEPVIERLKERADHGIYGYSFCDDEYHEAIISWQMMQNNWALKQDDIFFAPGVVPALYFLVQALSEPGDGVIIQQPVYYPFMGAVQKNNRRIINSPLAQRKGAYVMDFDDFEEKASDRNNTLFILCNPHNPVGRVWREHELRTIADICLRHGVKIISDEIHGDLRFDEYIHKPIASLNDEIARITVTCNSPSKSFNLAGLQTAYVIIHCDKIKERYRTTLSQTGLMGPNLFGIEALITAYRHGKEWLSDLLAYLHGNRELIAEYIATKAPALVFRKPEATYLAWIDCSALGMDSKQLSELLRQKAGLALDEGHIFGKDEGQNFVRLNFACPRSLLREALESLTAAMAG